MTRITGPVDSLNMSTRGGEFVEASNYPRPFNNKVDATNDLMKDRMFISENDQTKLFPLKPPPKSSSELNLSRVGGGPKSTYGSSVRENNSVKERSIIKTGCKRCFKILFSHVGTLAMVIIYMILGGFLFVYLEKDNEVRACFELHSKYASKLNSSVNRALSIAQTGYNASYMEGKLMETFKVFAKDVFTLSFDPLKNCSLIGMANNWPNWNLPNAIFFAATIMTTIGYGHIVPATMWGKVVCMVYAMLGIPIMLLFLTNIGEVMARLFRFLYINLCCCRCFGRPPRRENGDPQGKGLGDEWDHTVPVEGGDQPPPKVVMDTEDDEQEEEENIYVTIPITMTLIVLFCYILIGAALFSIWESPDWTFVDGMYFNFITLSTIGFGDLVPGKNGFENEETQIELLICAFYCLVGLAILSMCLNLIQDEIAAKFHWLGQKMGIVDNEDEDDLHDERISIQNEGEAAEHLGKPGHHSWPNVNGSENNVGMRCNLSAVSRNKTTSNC